MAIKGFTDVLSAAYGRLSESQRDRFDEDADASCTGGCDTDGSTVAEVFENGYELGKRAGDDDVFANYDADRGVCFYVGSEESLLELLKKYEEDAGDEPEGDDV